MSGQSKHRVLNPFLILDYAEKKMHRIWFVPLLTSSALVLMVCLVYGVVAIVYPLSLILLFSGWYLIMVFRAWRQADLNPRLEELRPSFWSNIYDVWLFVTDRETWRLYVSGLSGVAAALFGSFFGFVFQVSAEMSFSMSVASWISGMCLMVSIAIFMAKR